MTVCRGQLIGREVEVGLVLGHSGQEHRGRPARQAPTRVLEKREIPPVERRSGSAQPPDLELLRRERGEEPDPARQLRPGLRQENQGEKQSRRPAGGARPGHTSG